jgi:hypothetical protein
MRGLRRVDHSDWLRILTEMGWAVDSITASEVIRAQAQVRVDRLRLAARMSSVPSSIIAKTVPSRGESTPWAAARPGHAEAALHRSLSAKGAPLARLYWAGEIGGERYAMVFEDLAASAELFDHQHVWSAEDLLAVVDAAAELHAAGLRIGESALALDHPYLTDSPLGYVDSDWIRGIAPRANEHPLNCQDSSVSGVLLELADRYDAWLRRLRPWQTTVHGDIFWGNVAVAHEEGGRSRARLLDLGSAVLGPPQYDIEYLTQRGWDTAADWDSMRRHHRERLLQLVPQLAGDGALWRWGYRVALVQLMLWWHWIAIGILDRGDLASEREKQWVTRGSPLNPEFISMCRLALDEEPPV